MLHQRFNHRVVQPGDVLDKMFTEVYGKAYTESTLSPCDGCMHFKTHKVQHPRRSPGEKLLNNGTGPFGQVFCDTYAMPYPGRNGEWYFHLIYNSQRNVEALCSKTKGEVSQWLVDTMTKWQANGGKCYTLTHQHYGIEKDLPEEQKDGGPLTFSPEEKIRVFCPDGAKEFVCDIVTNWCKRNGTRMNTSAVNTPQHNETENMGKIVLQAMGASMWTSGLPYHYWPDCVYNVVDTHFVLPNKSVRGKWRTPCEAFHQREIPSKKLLKHHFTFGQLLMLHSQRTDSGRKHTHEMPIAEWTYNLGFSRGQKGNTVLVRSNNKVLEGCVNVFGLHRFPLAEMRDEKLMRRHQQEMRRQQVELFKNTPQPKDRATPDHYSTDARVTDQGEMEQHHAPATPAEDDPATLNAIKEPREITTRFYKGDEVMTAEGPAIVVNSNLGKSKDEYNNPTLPREQTTTKEVPPEHGQRADWQAAHQ